MQSLENTNVSEKFFKSGVSIGKGLTYQLDCRTSANRTLMDTPGLEDVGMRKQAAAAVTEALRKNGYYKVVFVLTLESGRIRTVDIATINLVLNYAPEITHFGLIFNKLSNQLYEKFQTDGSAKDEIMSEVFFQISRGVSRLNQIDKPIPFPLFLPNILDLLDFDDMTVAIPELETFMHGLPPITISKENVQDIPWNTLQTLVQELDKQFKALKDDNTKLHTRMVEDTKAFQTNLNYTIQNENERHERELMNLKKYYKHLLAEQEIARKIDVEQAARANAEILNRIAQKVDTTKREIDQKLKAQQRVYEQRLQETNEEALNQQEANERKLREVTQRLANAENDYKKWTEEVGRKESIFSMFFNFILPWRNNVK